jgi:D-alanyl-D-alanine carboxypeptidase
VTISRARRRDHGPAAALAVLVLSTTVSCASITMAAPTAAPSERAPVASAVPSPTADPTLSPIPERSVALTPPPATLVPRTPAPVAIPSPDKPGVAPGASAPALFAPAADPFPAVLALDRRLEGKLQKIVTKTARSGPLAGLSVAVMLPDGSVWTGSAGNAEYSPTREITAKTGFAIASVTKTFVAALILQLVDEGRLTLDEPYGTWLPDGPRAKTVTIRQLLNHRSGIHDFFDSQRYRDAVFEGDRDHQWTYDEIMDLVKDGYCRPEACYRYSNTNYVLLGRIAEVIEDKPLNRILRQRFFEPLGLDHTILQPQDPTPADVAHGFWRVNGRFLDHTRDSQVIPFMAAASVVAAAGAIVSTPRDLVVWADALYGGDILSRESRREMLAFLPPEYYGLGVRRGSFAGHAAVGHRGSLRGFESSMWYFPRDDVSIALLSNQGLWLTDVPLSKIAKAIFRSR